MNYEQYISPYKIKKQYDISSNTLRQWSEKGLIVPLRTKEGTGKRLYKVSDIHRLLNVSDRKERVSVCYARVSSDHQKEDLNRQIESFERDFPGREIIKDIGSGINYNRKGFIKLLERISNNEIERVYVTYKDRLCRFGSEIIEWIFKKFDTELVVLNKLSDSCEQNESIELAEDLLSITTVFVARNNGLRSAKFKRERKLKDSKKEEKEEQEEEKN